MPDCPCGTPIASEAAAQRHAATCLAVGRHIDGTCWDWDCTRLACVVAQHDAARDTLIWAEWHRRKATEDATYAALRDEHRRYWRDGPSREQQAARDAEIQAEWAAWVQGRRTA